MPDHTQDEIEAAALRLVNVYQLAIGGELHATFDDAVDDASPDGAAGMVAMARESLAMVDEATAERDKRIAELEDEKSAMLRRMVELTDGSNARESRIAELEAQLAEAKRASGVLDDVQSWLVTNRKSMVTLDRDDSGEDSSGLFCAETWTPSGEGRYARGENLADAIIAALGAAGKANET